LYNIILKELVLLSFLQKLLLGLLKEMHSLELVIFIQKNMRKVGRKLLTQFIKKVQKYLFKWSMLEEQLIHY
jgi:hypothetical protein